VQVRYTQSSTIPLKLGKEKRDSRNKSSSGIVWVKTGTQIRGMTMGLKVCQVRDTVFTPREIIWRPSLQTLSVTCTC